MHNGEGGVLYGGIRLEQPPLYTRPTIGIFIILKPCTLPAVGASPLQNTTHFSEESHSRNDLLMRRWQYRRQQEHTG